MLEYLLLIIGFIFLIKGADLLVDGAVSVADRMRIPSIVIGLTIVAFGTSTPELIVNILASAKGNTEIAIGNILGSNIANILLILGISALIYPITTNKNTALKEIPFSLLAALVVAVFVNVPLINGSGYTGITRSDGIILIFFFVIFLYYIFGIAKTTGELPEEVNIKKMSLTKSILLIIIGLLGLAIGGKWIVDGAVKIALSLNVSESLIGLTIVAIGTSLPELATSAVAAYKKQSDIAIGNIVGSNIFNIFWVLGISSIIRPLPFKSSLNLDVLMTITSSLILFLFMFIGRKRTIERWQGAAMLIIYAAYITFIAVRG